MPAHLQRTDWVSGARRTLYVGPHGGPKRISIDNLEMLIDGLRKTVGAIADDLGLSIEDVGSVELVDLIEGSCGVVFQQTARDSARVPLAIALDGVDAHLSGEAFPGILTDSSTSKIVSFANTLRSMATDDFPIFIEPRRADPASPLRQVPPSIAVVDMVDEVIARTFENNDESPLQVHSEWLLTFTGVLQRLDSAHRQMWVSTSRGLAKGGLNEALFKTADNDDNRWHSVTVVCIAESPDIKHIREILHVRPAVPGAPEWKEVPMNEAAKDIAEVLRRIDAIGALKPGWNSYSAAAPSSTARQAARGFLLLVASVFAADGKKLMPPFATPLADGRIQFEWEHDDTCLELIFAGNGSIDYLRMHGDDAVEEEGNRDRAIELVKWFHGRAAS